VTLTTAIFFSGLCLLCFRKFRWVAKGKYTSGPRSGQPSVCKWFKSNAAVFEDHYFDKDIKAVDKAAQIIHAWNQEKTINQSIR